MRFSSSESIRWRRKCAFSAVLSVILAVGPAAVTAKAGPGHGPYLQNLQVQRVTVCWELPRPHAGEVQLFNADGKLIKTFASATQAERHEVIVDGLRAGQRYSYDVVVQNDRSIGKGSFHSVPARGEPFSFVAWGDSRSSPQTSAALAAQILQSGAGMCIHSGDLVDDGKRLDQWDKQFFGPLADLLRNAILWPLVGNHDTGMMPDGKTSVFRHMFALPGEETYYSFDYGDAHFVVFDTTVPLAEQVKFAEEDLSKTDAKWKFAAWHHPPYSSGGHESHTQSRTQLMPLLARHNVDLIILGHNHHYMLSKPIRHVYEPLQKRAYLQLVTGGGGANPYDIDESRRWSGKGIKAYHFVLIEIDGDTLKAKAMDGRGRVLHRFEIDKTRPLENAVPFELIELERYLRGLDNVNTTLEGWPTGLVLAPGETGGRSIYRISNPLKEPLKLRMQFDMSAGLTFDPPMREIEIPAEKSVEISAPFRVTSQDKLYPVIGPMIAFECSLGKGQDRARAPLLALGRKVVASRIAEPITIDGKLNESAWSRAVEYGRFVLWTNSNLEFQGFHNESKLRVVRDADCLYLSLQRPAEQYFDDDRFSVFLAGESKALGVTANTNGTHSLEGSKGIGKDVVVAHTKGESGITWEIKVPLANFQDGSDKAGLPRWLNVMEKRGNAHFTLAPTFRQHPTRTNSATLILE